MANELTNLKASPGSIRERTRVGRGEGSGKGKTAGRGQKGQRARGTIAAGFEGGQMPIQRRLPKRGFTNIFAKDYTVVRLDRVALRYKKGETVDVESLKARGLVKQVGKDGIKVLGNGEISVALSFKAAKFTKSAADKIAAAGGSVEIG
jgi:large subunit ribosomal protein L15